MQEVFNPLVSIIMNCLNGEKFLKRAINSIYEQTYSNWEVIFIDNGSSDSSRIIAESYDNKIKIFSLEDTIELGEARNIAINKTRGDFIAFLDVDDEWLPTKLMFQINLFNNQDIGIVFCNTIIRENNNSSNLFNIMKPCSGEIKCKLLENNFITTSSLMYRKSDLLKLPFIFRGDFLLLVDYDLSIRVAGVCLADYVDKPLAIVYKHQDNASSSNKYKYLKESKIFIKYLYDKKNKFIENCSESVSRFMSRHNSHLAEIEFESGNILKAKKFLLSSNKMSIQNIFMYVLLTILPSYKIYSFLKLFFKKFFRLFKR
jgi:glycosyltransferase involved in cell wall biosynthesis